MKKLLSILYVLMMLQACNDEHLERFPQTSIAKENFFNNEEDLATYVYSLYDFPGFSIYTADASTDNAASTGATEIKNMMLGSPSASSIQNGWDWEPLRRINYFLENVRRANAPEEVINHYEGLGRFFRARFYMEKVKRYSDVPWYDKVLTTDDPDLYKGRDPRKLVVDKIFEDYAYAAEHVREDSRAGAVNRWVVLAFQARHALYEGTFRKYHPELGLESSAESFLTLAESASATIMEEGGFSLYSTGNPDVDYGHLFNSIDLESNPEIILGTFNEFEELNSGWWAFMFGNYEVNPVRDLMQTYLMKDGSRFTDRPGFETFLFVEEFEDRDPRLYQTYAYPGWELVNTSTYAQGAGVYIQQLTKNFSGYHQLKGFVNTTNVEVQSSVDIPVLRYAEILLINAEAKAEMGSLSQADLDVTVNLLRARAGMEPLSIAVGIDPVLQNQYPNVSGTNVGVLLEIRRERRVELALEGFRFDDLMRWHAGKLIEKEPEGLYFPGLGTYDLTGDGIVDIKLISNTESIPADGEKESNSLGRKLVYYRVGPQNSDASFYLSNGTSGTCVTDPDRGIFEEPKFYYRPVPQSQVLLNPELGQIFGW